ncbi:Molybdopterin synthase catalytic subunit [Hyaloraphidium curvatum]|nr:Molybdopterin synthase catalytic subunit [Hyaloraphidium curvatum]
METLEDATPAGGRSRVAISEQPISSASVADAVRDDACGAISLFEGTTRDTFGGRRVLRLEYEAYVPMALKEMMKLCSEARERWPELVHVAVDHRIGVVPVREPSVVIAVSSPHRRDAIAACEWLIDELKARVPIWKKEWYEGEDSAWKMNAECVGCSTRRPERANGHGHGHGHSHEPGHHHHHPGGDAAVADHAANAGA